MIYILAIVFFFGLIIGSFLNVVILRHNTGRSLDGRSGCMSCGKKLTWKELFPVLSWLLQKGKCKGCGSKVSMQYPLVELATALLFVGGFFFLTTGGVYDIVQILSLGVVLSMLVIIFAYDLKHMIIPDGWSLIFAIASLVFASTYWFASPLEMVTTIDGLWHILAGLIFFIPFWALWFFSKGTWMGLGDGKLVVGIGWLLGLGYGITAITFGFWLGAIIGIIILLITRFVEHSGRITMKSEIPFGPFLIAGTIIVLFLQMNIMDIMNGIL